ncbi:glycosyl transferase [Pirellulaceae bacterium SH449]
MEVAGYRFQRSDLRIADRVPGISAFMRIKNGQDFLELTIRSHIAYFDEIVAVYNQCTDGTADILQRLQAEFGSEKLRVFHYTDRVFPPGSDDHSKTASDSPSSLVNYYNFALAATRYTHATKLDDDHLAIPSVLEQVTEKVRRQLPHQPMMKCFSGLNLFPGPDDSMALCRRDPISGGGDIGFFRVTHETFFTRDRRFEKFQRGGIPRRFSGYLYWHLKYLKPEMGFANYELERYQNSRYAQRKYRLLTDDYPSIQLKELARQKTRQPLSSIKSLFSEKQSLLCKRDQAIESSFPYETCDQALERTVSPEMLSLFYQTLESQDQRG